MESIISHGAMCSSSMLAIPTSYPISMDSAILTVISNCRGTADVGAYPGGVSLVLAWLSARCSVQGKAAVPNKRMVPTEPAPSSTRKVHMECGVSRVVAGSGAGSAAHPHSR